MNHHTPPPSNRYSVSGKRPAPRKVRRKKNGRFPIRFTLFILFFFLLCLGYMGILAIQITSFKSQDQPVFYSLSVRLPLNEEGEEQQPLSFESEQMLYHSSLYLPVSVLDNFTDIVITGDNKVLTVWLSAGGEHADFYLNTNNAVINGNDVLLSAESFVRDSELYLPLDFFSTMLYGVTMELNEEDAAYLLHTVDEEPISFKLKSLAPIQALSLDGSGTGTSVSGNSGSTETGYLIDISPYEKYISPENRDEYLFIVSKDNPLSADDIPTDLTDSDFTRSDREKQKLRLNAKMALDAFLKEAAANGYKNITITSAYRSYSYQNSLYNSEIERLRGRYGEQAEAEAAKAVNPPGISEHQTGLAVDMHNMSAASQAFGDTKEAKWLEENAYRFGFILRYPKDKTEITGIQYEPWHFRYVGKYHATKMKNLNMCLEEYMEYIKK